MLGPQKYFKKTLLLGPVGTQTLSAQSGLVGFRVQDFRA